MRKIKNLLLTIFAGFSVFSISGSCTNSGLSFFRDDDEPDYEVIYYDRYYYDCWDCCCSDEVIIIYED